MARDRWTLALILICLPILATVITAFRIRDLPKSHDSSKLATKKTPQCENCDVKVGQKVHSVKIESDKHKYVDLKKTVREKQELINEKITESKSSHKYDVKSEEDKDDDDLEFSTIQTGFRQEYPKGSKTKKSSFSLHKKDDNADVENDDDDDDDDDKNRRKVMFKPKILEVNKVPSNKPKFDAKGSQIKVPVKKLKPESSEENDEDDDDDDHDGDKSKVIHKPKVPEVKKTLSVKPKHEAKSSEIEIVEAKEEKTDSPEDDDDDDNEDDEDDDYEGLDYIEELFKILDMKPSTKIKITENNQQPKLFKETKSQMQLGKKEEDSDDDSDDGDDDSMDDSKLLQESKLKIILTKTPQPAPKDIKVKSETNVKKPLVKAEKESTDPEKKLALPLSKDTKDKIEESPKKTTSKEVVENIKVENKDLKLETLASESKKPAVVKKGAQPLVKAKTNELPAKKTDNEKTEYKSQTVTNKENKKKPKDTKTIEEKLKTDPVKKPKDSEKHRQKPTPQEKDSKSSSHEDSKTVDKKIIQEPKTSEHKDIFKTPEHKKDIKYDFEKPNAYKDSQKSFDYTEFEKMQVLKSHHKEHKKKEKTSSEKISDSREERYLKHVTDALGRRNLLKSEFEDFYAFLPTFAPNFSRIHNPECRRHGQILLRQLRGTKLWALNMLDATAKIPSGVLQGNGIQLGDFDQCLASRARVQLDTGSVVKVQGKYCLARIDVKAEHTELEAPVYLAQAKNLIRSKIDDPGHFVPRFSTLSWGVCVPSACNREDVEVIIKDAIKHYQHKSGVVVKVKVDEDDCHTDEEDSWEEWLELPTILTMLFYGVILLLVLVATIQDFARRQPEEGQEEKDEQVCDQKEKDKEENTGESKKLSDNFLSTFSLYRTLSKLMAPGTTDEISCIHGVRGIATIALLVAHKFMPVAVMPYSNRVKVTELASSPLWSWCRAGWVFTDCFLLLSGALTAHRIASDSNTGAFRRLFSRYLRLTPALLAVVLFYAFVWDKVSTGPMWGAFVTKNAKVCEEGWWWNMLYVQNYFGLEDMCAPQTHQLALDMQLTILGGIIIWVTQSGLTFAKLVLPAVHLIAVYFRYTTVRDHRLTLLAYHGVSVSQLYRTARLSYTSTLHRCSPYLIGLSLGLALKKPSKHGKFLLALGWLTSVGLFALVVWSGIDSGSMQYRYNAAFAAQYAAIAPLASAMAIAWVIYAVHNGTSGFLSRVLCWRPLVFISRLSYALYLCQFIIFITNIGTVRTSREFTLMSLLDLQEISAILLSSTILTVTFVIPMQSLHKIFSFEWKSDSEKSSEAETEESEPIPEEIKSEGKKEAAPLTRSRHSLVAHREVLEEIPEVEVEYETQRDSAEGLDEIIEEEEGTMGEEEDEQIDGLEIIEEEEAGEEEAWLERHGERPYSRGDDQDLDEWEWTANGGDRTGAQYYRYAR